jgi:exodeoxyribonuclease-3
MTAVRIATWNVNGLRARLALVLHWLHARQPDVVGLQELKLTDDQFPHPAFEDAGYRAVAHGQKGWNGVAILSREPFEVTQRGLPGQEDAGARLITAAVAGLSFTTIYCPNGKNVDHEDFPRKLVWLDTLRKHLHVHGGADAPVIVCGDFNLCPGPLDTWNEEAFRGAIFHTDAERSRFASLLACGLHDVFRERFPDTRAFSWWDYRAGAFHRGMGLRLDLLLATAPVAARVRAIEIDRAYRKKTDGLAVSDHAPVIADLV